MPRKAVAHSSNYTIDEHGRRLWPSLDHAMTYANVRAMFYKTRQEIAVIPYLGVPMFWVHKARGEEPPC